MSNDTVTVGTTMESREQLDEFMHDLSEEYWSAGWVENLEMRLWAIIHNEEPNRPNITEEELATLSTLSALAGGWFSFEDDVKARENNDDAYFIPMDEWLKEYARRKKHVKKTK